MKDEVNAVRQPLHPSAFCLHPSVYALPHGRASASEGMRALPSKCCKLTAARLPSATAPNVSREADAFLRP